MLNTVRDLKCIWLSASGEPTCLLHQAGSCWKDLVLLGHPGNISVVTVRECSEPVSWGGIPMDGFGALC